MNCLKKKRGFSLIELMVVVAIMGILASIGIPQYLRYRDSAAWGRIDTELRNTHRAFVTCISTMAFEQCDALNELGLADLEDVSASGGMAMTGDFCVGITRMIGALEAEGCVNINAFSTNRVFTLNQSTCVEDGGASTWDAGMSQWDTTGGMIAGVDAVVPPGTAASKQNALP